MAGTTARWQIPYPTGTDRVMDGDNAMQAIAERIDVLLPPPGSLVPYAGSTAPSGWLLAQGQEVSRTTYAALWSAIGPAYGAGDGSTTFNLPDLRSRVPVGAGQGAGLRDRARGAAGGQEDNQLPTHTHGGNTGGQSTDHAHAMDTNHLTADYASGTGKDPERYVGDGTGRATHGVSVDHTHAFTTGAAGSSPADTNMAPYLVINWLVKT